MSEDGGRRTADHVRNRLLSDYEIGSRFNGSLTPKALDAGMAGSTMTPEDRRGMQDQVDYSVVSPSLREALNELVVALRVGAGDDFLVIMRREVVRHERQKDAAIIGLLSLLRMWGNSALTAKHEDGCNCGPCFLTGYAESVLNEESRRARTTFEDALEQLRHTKLTPAQESAERDSAPGLDT
jgi:hypothetical protein